MPQRLPQMSVYFAVTHSVDVKKLHQHPYSNDQEAEQLVQHTKRPEISMFQSRFVVNHKSLRCD